MMGYVGATPPLTSSIYVCNLPPGTDETLLANHFGTIGLLKVVDLFLMNLYTYFVCDSLLAFLLLCFWD